MGRSKAPSLPIKALSFCRPTELRWEGGGASHQRGMHFRRPQGGCMVFAAKGGIRNGAEGAHLASAAILYTSRGREHSTRPGGVSRSRTEPLAPRAVRPGGAINPRGEAASTFGNTGKHRLSHGPDHDPDPIYKKMLISPLLALSVLTRPSLRPKSTQ